MPNLNQSVPAVYAYSGFDGVDYGPISTDTNPGSVINLGDNLFAVARQLIPAGTKGTLAMVGIFDLLLEPGTSFHPGHIVFWDTDDNMATADGSYASDIIGTCIEAANIGDKTVRVWLNSAFHY